LGANVKIRRSRSRGKAGGTIARRMKVSSRPKLLEIKTLVYVRIPTTATTRG
jgi:hypothetical protein